MKIGFCYDFNEDYGFESNDLIYCDFISPVAATFVKRTLERCGYEVHLIGNYKKLLNQLANGYTYDLLFSAAEGIKSRNRESWIASIAEMYNIPYAGTDAFGLNVTLDKSLTKIISKYLDIPTPAFIELNNDTDIEKISFKYPFILKPNNEGSSMGVYLIHNIEDLRTKSALLFHTYAQKLLVEEYISGKEITVSIVENDGQPYVFGLAESIQNDGSIMPIYSSEIKRIYGCKKILPRISEKTKALLEAYSLKIYKYLECRDYCRIDFRLDKEETPYLLEVTPLPALSETASFMASAKLKNIKPEKIFECIIKNACSRYHLLPKS